MNRYTHTHTRDFLEALGLFPAGTLLRNGDRAARAAESVARGDMKEKYPASEIMYQQLRYLLEALDQAVRCHSTALSLFALTFYGKARVRSR